MMASDEARINRSDIRAQLTDLLASADRVLPTSAMTSVYRHLCWYLYVQIAVAHALHRVRLELRRQAWPSPVTRNAMARSRAPGRPWLDLTVPNTVSDENCGGGDGHAPWTRRAGAWCGTERRAPDPAVTG